MLKHILPNEQTICVVLCVSRLITLLAGKSQYKLNRHCYMWPYHIVRLSPHPDSLFSLSSSNPNSNSNSSLNSNFASNFILSFFFLAKFLFQIGARIKMKFNSIWVIVFFLVFEIRPNAKRKSNEITL